MAYTPTEWKSGDVISAERMNKIEQGIANGSSSVLIVDATQESTSSDSGDSGQK